MASFTCFKKVHWRYNDAKLHVLTLSTDAVVVPKR